MQIEERLGEGHSSEVRRCVINGISYAMKVFRKGMALKFRQREVQMLQSLDHQSIVKVIECHPNMEWYVCELQKKDLFSIILNAPLDIESARAVLWQLSAVIKYLHVRNIVHRDIKLENVMISEKGLKIIDFGFAIQIDDHSVYNRHCGTSNYMAPELHLKDTHIQGKLLPPGDIFALGVLLFTIVYGYPPFSASTNECKYWQHIINNKWTIFWGIVDRKTQKSTPEFRDLLQKMFHPDPLQRFTIHDVIDHPFLDGKIDLSLLTKL